MFSRAQTYNSHAHSRAYIRVNTFATLTSMKYVTRKTDRQVCHRKQTADDYSCVGRHVLGVIYSRIGPWRAHPPLPDGPNASTNTAPIFQVCVVANFKVCIQKIIPLSMLNYCCHLKTESFVRTRYRSWIEFVSHLFEFFFFFWW